MMQTRRKKTDYGGFLPLELNPGQELFEKYKNNLLRFNSIKASLNFLIQKIQCGKIYVPYYYCPSTINAIKKTGIEVNFYHVNKYLMPQNLPDERKAIILLVDYFGVKSEQIREYIRSFCNAEIIIDRAHGFYEEPVFSKHIYNVYSAKKFFGIPDGAYIVSRQVFPGIQVPSRAHPYAGYLLKAYEEGTNTAYESKKETDKLIAADYTSMSILSIGLMQNVDYQWVENRRRNNYRTLYTHFANVNELEIPEECAAYQFPLLISDIGKVIKKRLIEERIFVSTLWNGKDLLDNGNAFELNMSENAVFLPIDQRYDTEDMNYIAAEVERIL